MNNDSRLLLLLEELEYQATYDASNRLVGVSDSSSTVQTNEYDGLNRRIVRANSNVTRHFYYNNQWQVLVEATGTTTLTPDVIYSYHPQYVDAVANRMTASECHVYLTDANYNVTAMLDATSSASPAVVERYNYTPYGVVTVLDASFADDADNKSDIDNEYLYTGRRRDPETGLQLNRNRFYHVVWGGG